MIRFFILLTLIFLPFQGVAKEWKSLKAYQKETNQISLQPQDWLKSDRKHNTNTWMNANHYNLVNNKSEEYATFRQRKDFYAWIDDELKAKGHEVVWPSMAYFISNKMRLLKCFPYQMLTGKKMKQYAQQGSDAVFASSFETLKDLYLSETILKDEKANDWDETILHDEQYIWIEEVYQTIDERSIQKIERVAKGKSFFAIFVPKQIRFEGEIDKADDRYDYALEKLRTYCKSLKK